MGSPIKPKYPIILKNLMDKSNKTPDIDLSNIGGGSYPIKHITLTNDRLMLVENTYLIIDNPLDEVIFEINPFENKKCIICDVVVNDKILNQSILSLGCGPVYKDVIVNIDGVDTTMKYGISPMIFGDYIFFNEELEEPIKHIYIGSKDDATYSGEVNFVLKEANDIFTINIMGFEITIGSSIKLVKDGDVYKGSFSFMGQTAYIIHTKPIIEFGDMITLDLMGEIYQIQAFYYKKPDLTKVNEYIVEFSADSVEISEELIFNNNAVPSISKNGRTVLSIVNGICAYLNIQ